MNWRKQILHIVQRDLQHAKFPLMIYLAAITLATVAAVTVSATHPAIFLLPPTLIGVIGASIVATAVQADSPVRNDALWVSQPFYPSALLAAKGVATVLLLILALVFAQVIMLATAGVGIAAHMGGIVTGAWMTLRTLLVVAALASLTRDMRSLVVAVLVFLFALLAVPMLLLILIPNLSPAGITGKIDFNAIPGVNYAPRSIITFIAWPIAAFAVLAHQYITRQRRRGILLGITLLLALQFEPLTSGTIEISEIDILTKDVPVVVPVGELVVHSELISGDDYAMMEHRAHMPPRHGVNVLQVRYEGAPANVRRLLLLPQASLLLADGSRSKVSVATDRVVLNDPDPVGADGYREVSARRSTGSAGFVPLQLSSKQSAAISAGGATLEISGEVLERESQSSTLPLVVGARTILGDAAISLVSHFNSADSLRFSVTTLSGMHPLITQFEQQLGVPRFALVNQTTSEIVWLAGDNQTHLPARQLIGPTLLWEENQLLEPYTIGQGSSTLSTLPHDWTSSAKLLVTTWHSTGRFQVVASATITSATSRQLVNVTPPDVPQSSVSLRMGGGL